MESKPKEFIEREYNDDIIGELDEDGFFTTPNGSFWDPDYVYFNREGYDKHGGYYDENNEYIPGENWDEKNQCYLDEKEQNFENYLNDYDDAYDDYYEGDDYNYHNVQMDDIIDEEKYIRISKDIEVMKDNDNFVDIKNDETKDEKKINQKKNSFYPQI